MPDPIEPAGHAPPEPEPSPVGSLTPFWCAYALGLLVSLSVITTLADKALFGRPGDSVVGCVQVTSAALVTVLMVPLSLWERLRSRPGTRVVVAGVAGLLATLPAYIVLLVLF